MRLTTRLAAAALLVFAPAALADEGMWLLNNPPGAALKAKYGFEPSKEFLEHVQKSCVRFSTGGSGSIISDTGLVMTNHHVGSDMLQKKSTPAHDLLKTGFFARTNDEEIKCDDLELNVLWSTEDVTDRIRAAQKPAMSAADANTARRKAMAAMEQEEKGKTGLHCQVVTLYQGGKYHLYRYKRYTDVRIVFAPEQTIAFYGGDTDNFEFPRFDLDVCLFRIYENGKPLKPEHHLSWSAAGGKENELALVFGHPGTTRRLFTVDHLKFLRDIDNPMSLRSLMRQEVRLACFRGRSEENARTAEDEYFGITNSRKALVGQLEGLQDPRLIARKAEAEQHLRSAVDANPEFKAKWGDAWASIAKAEQGRAAWHSRYYILGRSGGGLNGGELLSHAREIVRLAEELPKPSVERLREYGEQNLESVYLGLYSPAPIYEAFEIERLASGLAFAAEVLGADDPTVAAALAGKSPHDRAVDVVKGTTLKDVEARKKLVAGGKEAVKASKDPMIALALALDPEARTLRAKYENEAEAAERENYAKIAAAKFAVEGESAYPDATFTLRMSFGPIKGYTDADAKGGKVPAFTTFAGLYERGTQRKGQEGFEIPQRWLGRKDRLDPKTPFNFVCTADIIGGNSGSPVVNTKGEVIGLIFDGNIYSLVGGIVYDEAQNRAVSVDSRAIMEALRKVYDAGALADEIARK